MEAEPPKAEPPKRKRRWFQFSMRTMMIFTAIIAIGCAWLGRRVEEKRKEREAVAAIERFGGHAYYDYQMSGPMVGIRFEAQAPGPDWLKKVLGDNFFSEVSIVGLDSKDVTGFDLTILTVLSRLQYLDLQDSQITDAGLVNVKGMAQLQDLDLSFNNVTDGGLTKLKGLTQLRGLHLKNTQVTDVGVKELQKVLPNCHISR